MQIGRLDLSDNNEDYETIAVDYELLHPDNDDYSLDNDIILLKLSTDSEYTPVSNDNGSQTIDNGDDVTIMG